MHELMHRNAPNHVTLAFDKATEAKPWCLKCRSHLHQQSTAHSNHSHNTTTQNKTKRPLAFLCLFALHRRSQIHTKKPANTSTANDTEHNDTEHRRHMQLHTATTATTQQHKTKQNALFLFLVCFLSTDVAKSTQRSQRTHRQPTTQNPTTQNTVDESDACSDADTATPPPKEQHETPPTQFSSEFDANCGTNSGLQAGCSQNSLRYIT